jgi:twitching mobility protein
MQKFEVDVSKLDFARRDKINEYLRRLLGMGGTDLHVKSGGYVYGRIGNDILKLSDEIFTGQDGIILAKELLRTRFGELVELKSVDFTHRLGGYRFRVNAFFQLEGVSVVFRLIPDKIPTLEERFLPPIVEKICDTVNKGIILIVGQPGSGKATTVASIIERINLTKRRHIATVEDSVKFVYTDAKSVVTQRAVGQDTLNFSCGVRSALKEDADIVAISSVKDADTVRAMILSAQMGRLVIGVLTGCSVADSIEFLTNFFREEDKNNVKTALVDSVEAVIAQRMVKTLDNDKRVAAAIMINHVGMKKALMSGDESKIYDAIERGRDGYGMQTFDQCLFELYSQGVIDESEALLKASDEKRLKRKIEGSVLAKGGIAGCVGDAELIERLKDEL